MQKCAICHSYVSWLEGERCQKHPSYGAVKKQPWQRDKLYTNEGFLKWADPQSIHFNRMFYMYYIINQYKQSIFGV